MASTADFTAFLDGPSWATLIVNEIPLWSVIGDLEEYEYYCPRTFAFLQEMLLLNGEDTVVNVEYRKIGVKNGLPVVYVSVLNKNDLHLPIDN